MYSMAVSHLDTGASIDRQRSISNRQCSVYASRLRPSLSPIDTAEQAMQLPQLPPLPVSPRWDSLSNGTHLILSSPSDDEASLAERRGRAAPELLLKTSVENFSRPRKQSLRQPSEQSNPVPRLLATTPTDLYDLCASTPHTPPPWQRPRRRPSASSFKSASPFSSPLGPPPSVDLPVPKPGRARNAAGPPLTTAARAPLATSPMAAGGGAAPWMSDERLRSSFRSQLTESSAFGTTERSSVLTKDSSITSLYTDEPSVEDVMCMYEKGFADDDDDDHHHHREKQEGRRGEGQRGGRHNHLAGDDEGDGDDDADDDEDDDEDDFDIDGDSDGFHRNASVVTATLKDAARPLTAMSEPAADAYLAPPATRSALDAEIRRSKMLFVSPAFTASVPALSGAADLDVTTEKRDSGKSLDSAPSMTSSGPPLPPPTTEPTPPRTSPTSLFRAAMEPEDPGSRDRYGFKKQNQSVTREQYDAWNKDYTPYLARRRKKWAAYLKECGLMTDRPMRFPPPNGKTKRFVRKGIPPDWRGAAWFYYAGGPAILAQHSGLYEKLLQREAKPVDVEAIERDLHRTFPDNVQFQPSPGSDAATEPPIISSLRRVLHAFAVYNPRIGYCQSLNFLAGLLLLFVETEEQCFWLLNVITVVYLPGTHDMSLEGSKVDLGVLMTELRDTMPAVWDKIGGELEASTSSSRATTASATSSAAARPGRKLWRRDQPQLSTERLPPITLCMTAWFMSCYIGTLPMETTLRVWDVFFYEGSKTLFRIALAIFKSGEAEIKAVSDPMEMFGVVQSLPRRMLDANGLIETCFKRRNGFGHLSQDAIDERRQERRDKVRTATAPTATGTTMTDDEAARRKGGTLFGRRRRDASRTRES